MKLLISGLAATLFYSLPLAAAPIAPTADNNDQSRCYTFREKQWRFFRSNPKQKLPKVGKIPELLLTPDNTFHTGVAAAINSPVKPPFEISFDYSTWDDDGSEWAIWNSADGLAFFFLKDASDYGNPPDGGALGLNPEGGGYAVWFKLYDTRSVGLTGPGDITLDWERFAKAYTQRQWVPVKIEVCEDSIQVWANDQPVLNHHAAIDDTYSDLGFSAATGAADAEQAVRNLCIKPLAAKEPLAESQETIPGIPLQQQEGFEPAPGLEGIDAWPVQTDKSDPES